MRSWILPVVALSTLAVGCETVHRTAHLVQAPARCADQTFPIYFASGSVALTAPALQAIRTAADQSKGCQAVSVSVVGLADADGGAQRNEQLSRDRAQAVAAALAAQGFPKPAFDIEAAGAAGAKTATGATVPTRRRAEVAIAFKH